MLVDAISWFGNPNSREIRSEQLHRVYRIETLNFAEIFRERERERELSVFSITYTSTVRRRRRNCALP